MSEQILIKHEQDSFFEENGESEVANILNGMSQLGYRNNNVLEALHSNLVGPEYEITGEIQGQYDLFTLYNIITSFARLAPEKTEYLKDFVPQLHKMLSQIGETPDNQFREQPHLAYMFVPDITMFVNLWLSLATFAALQPNYQNLDSMGSSF